MNIFSELFGIFRQRGLVETYKQGNRLTGFFISALLLVIIAGALYGFAPGIDHFAAKRVSRFHLHGEGTRILAVLERERLGETDSVAVHTHGQVIASPLESLQREVTRIALERFPGPMRRHAAFLA